MMWLLYGATGFTGTLLAEHAVQQGMRPVLAGRSEAKLQPLAARLGLDYRVFELDHLPSIIENIRDFSLVFHAAGPFIETADKMMQACALSGVHYLDITGEIVVFERGIVYDQVARKNNCALISGVGFDVVPTNCLAQYVADQLPDATHLEIAVDGLTRISAGTARTAVENGASGGWIRRKGKLIPYPLGAGAKTIQFSHQERRTMPIPWGDLSTAFQSTGIPNITTYMAFPPHIMTFSRFGGPIGQFLLAIGPVRRFLSALMPRLFKGPDAEQQARFRSYLWAQAMNEAGETVQAWMETPEPYVFTALAGLWAVERTLADHPVGVLAPATAFGADFPLEIEGVRRYDSLPQQL